LAKQIAKQVGFSDANYFARRFHRAFGVTPLAYRESVRV
jgi:AraC-like DNA-binding protein